MLVDAPRRVGRPLRRVHPTRSGFAVQVPSEAARGIRKEVDVATNQGAPAVDDMSIADVEVLGTESVRRIGEVDLKGP